MKYLIIVSCLTILIAASCKKNKSKTELEKLPPITQSGANTFGCLVNGKMYVPKGYIRTGTPNPKISFDFYNTKAIFSINSNHFENGNPIGFMDISFFDTVLLPGIYEFPKNMNFSIGWPKILNNCFTPAFDTTIKKWGIAIITKLDNTNRILSGTFNCKFKTLTCDTVYITDGRFDFKF